MCRLPQITDLLQVVHTLQVREDLARVLQEVRDEVVRVAVALPEASTHISPHQGWKKTVSGRILTLLWVKYFKCNIPISACFYLLQTRSGHISKLWYYQLTPFESYRPFSAFVQVGRGTHSSSPSIHTSGTRPLCPYRGVLRPPPPQLTLIDVQLCTKTLVLLFTRAHD